MKKHKMNASNWSGKDVDYWVYENGDLGVYDSRFKFSESTVGDDIFWKFDGLCEVLKDRNEFVAFSGDISREGSTVHEAAAKLASNIL